MKIGFGMGQPARVSWIAFITDAMKVSDGFYPVYLYYKSERKLVLAYGISETKEHSQTWPDDFLRNTVTLKDFFDNPIPRYGSSFVFESYDISIQNEIVSYHDSSNGMKLESDEIEKHLKTIIDQFQTSLSNKNIVVPEHSNNNTFHLEKHLEEFLIFNWDETYLGKKFDLLIDEGTLLSQQYKTDIGYIDLLVKDKKNGNYVVIELKKGQTSDATIGQVTRYMGWVKQKLEDQNVRGIIIASEYDQKLEYALQFVNEVDLLTYKIDFKLSPHIINQ